MLKKMSNSDDDYVNPELPPEIAKIQNEDLIGNTLFSKHLLFELLLKLIQKVENEQVDIQVEDNKKLKTYDPSNFKELDSDFEKELCDLWDMSVEIDVCHVLDEFNAIQIFEGFIKKFDYVYPRAIEILIGIFINMASLSDKICYKLVSNKSLIQYLLFNVLSQMADVPTIIQVIRFFDIFLSDQTDDQKNLIKPTFIDYLKHELVNPQIDNSNLSLNWHGIMEKFYFILEQSLNPQLLDITSSLLFKLFDNDEEILSAFCTNHRIIDSLCNGCLTRLHLDKIGKTFTHSNFTTSRRNDESERVNDDPTNNKNQATPYITVSTYTNQLSEDDISTIDHLVIKFFLCLHTLSTCESGVIALFDRSEVVIELFDEYLDKCLSTFNDWEIKSSRSIKATVSDESLKNLICLLSVLNSIFPDDKNLIECHHKHEKFFPKLITLCNYFLKLVNEIKKHESETDKEYVESFNLVKSNILELFNNLGFLNKEDNISIAKLLNESIKLLIE